MDGAAHPPQSICVATVRGQLLDGGDVGVSAPLAVCSGSLLCAGSAADEGIFSVNLNHVVDLSTFVLHVYGHPYHGDMIVPLQRATTSVVTLNMLPRVPRFEHKGNALPAQTASNLVVRSGAVEVTLAAGTTTEVLPAHEQMRELLEGVVPDATTWDPNIIALYAVGPFGARMSPPVAVAIDLPAGARVAEGAAVELVVLEDDLSQGHAAGTLLKVGVAEVKGGVARSVAGSGIDRLTWVGVRLTKGL
jgi:hypothetical protein